MKTFKGVREGVFGQRNRVRTPPKKKDECASVGREIGRRRGGG